VADPGSCSAMRAAWSSSKSSAISPKMQMVAVVRLAAVRPWRVELAAERALP